MEPTKHVLRVSIFSWVFTGILASLLILAMIIGFALMFSDDHGFYISIVDVFVFFILSGMIFGLLNWGYQRQSYATENFSNEISPKNIYEVFIINLGTALSMFAGAFVGAVLVGGWVALVLS